MVPALDDGKKCRIFMTVCGFSVWIFPQTQSIERRNMIINHQMLTYPMCVLFVGGYTRVDGR
jgi:hypothetical protein